MQDFLRSDVNAYVNQGERITLPRPSDVTTDVVAAPGEGPGTLFGTVT